MDYRLRVLALRLARVLGIASCVALATGCANVEPKALPQPAHEPHLTKESRPIDPLEALLAKTVTEWNAAHNEHDRKRLEAVYDSTLRYDGFRLKRDVVLRLKEAGFTRSPSARQSVDGLVVDRSVVGLPTVTVRRTVFAMQRIRSTETRLAFSCDAKTCLVVDEEEKDFSASIARARALAAHPGSCPEAMVAYAISSKDAKAVLAGRSPQEAAFPIAMPPESTHYAVVLLDRENQPAALYEIAPGTLDMTEALPGDLTQEGDPAAKEHAKRACTSR